MNHVASRPPLDKASSPPRRRHDVEALIALVSLDHGVARRGATVAGSLATVEGTGAEIASCERESTATREALQRRAGTGAQTPALAASAELRDPSVDLPVRRAALASRIPPATLEDYETALRRGLFPAAVATRGRVCWGCFHGLPAAITAEFHEAQTFMVCPYCERVLFNPDWIEGR